jgi:UDP-N-acetylglucosamine 4,6-dehydratase (inverting)
MLNNSTTLIKRRTGSYGKSFVSTILIKYKKINRRVIYSRDELKQLEMSNEINIKLYPFVRYFIGDVRDKERLTAALNNINYVIHCAALKQVPTAEFNPLEYIKTNVIGAQNVIEACLSQRSIEKVIALSTDKAAAPINLYGATKLCADKLFISANNITGRKELIFSVVRYGNVLGSRGSAIPRFLKQRKSGKLQVTDLSMTRFNITLDESVEFVLWVLENSLGGEIFVPKIPSYRLSDVVEVIGSGCKIKNIGIRSGEKLHEEMITKSDSVSTVDFGNCYAILSPNLFHEKNYVKNYCKLKKARLVKKIFSYNSEKNRNFLSKEKIKKLIKREFNSIL